MKNSFVRVTNVSFAAVLVIGLAWVIGTMVSPSSNGYAATKGPLVNPDETKILNQINRELTAISRAVTPAVVTITGTKQVRQSEGRGQMFDDPFFRHFFGRELPLPREWQERFLGSGAIVSEDGYIITNHHVVDKAKDKEVTVVLADRRELTGKIVGADAKTDLAVVKVDAKGLPSLPWGDSNALQVGETVLAIGSPFNYSQTVTKGMVSFIGRTGIIDGGHGYESFIQTDAAINPGNSGGPLVNIRGEIVGVNAAIASASGGFQGIGFAIPSNLARTVLESVVKYGKVMRPWLGVSIRDLDEGLAESFGAKNLKGALVNEVSKDSPAEKAGIKRGDVITHLGGADVLDSGNLKYLVGQSQIDSTVKVTLIRDGKKKELDVKLEVQPKDFESRFGGGRTESGEESEEPEDVDYDNVLKGITVQELTEALSDRLDIPSSVEGVLVADVDAESVAARKGLRRGDVIEEVKRQPVKTVADFNRIASKIKKDETVLLSISRQGTSLFVALTPSGGSGEKEEKSE